MQYLSAVDFLIAIPYILVLLLISIRYCKRNKFSSEDKKTFIRALLYRFALLIFYIILICYVYGFGDNLSYFIDSLSARKAVSEGSVGFWQYLGFGYSDFLANNWRDAGSGGGVLVEKLSFLLSYISFKNYLVTSLLFCFIGYFGIWKMFQVFNKVAPSMRRMNSIIVLFMPTVTIYGAPILKDTIGIFALGYIVFYIHKIFVEKKYGFGSLLMLLFFTWLLYFVRSFVALALLSPLVILMLFRFVSLVRKNFIKALALLAVYGILFTILFLLFFNKLQTKIIEDFISELRFNRRQYDIVEGGSNFNNNVTENFTFNDLLINFPQGIFNVIFRPFIFEARSFLMLLSGLENLFIFVLILRTIIKTKFSVFLRYLSQNPFNLYLLSFSLFFCGFVSFYSSNFGTISRYRIPGIPLFLFGILAVNHYVRTGKNAASVKQKMQ